MRLIRIFISSPGDVAEERDKAEAVIRSLDAYYGGRAQLVPVRWENLGLSADASFQEGVVRVLTAEGGVDIAIFIMWSRLGTPQGAWAVRSDGRPYRSGTEQEFDLMLSARRESGGARPHLLAYVRSDDRAYSASLAAAPVEEHSRIVAQRTAAQDFIRETFTDAATGQNLRAFHTYDQPVTFADRLRIHLRDVLDQLVGVEAGAVRWDEAPYRGLEVFDVDHEPIFRGREEQVCEILQRLRQCADNGCAFVVIIGASGSGKSSLARAGVAAHLLHFNLDDAVRRWRCAVFTPGMADGALFAGLARALASAGALPELCSQVDDLGDLAGELENKPESAVKLVLRPAFRAADSAAGGAVRLLLVLDQFEELYTDRRISSEDREKFLAALEILARSGSIHILATLRSDFYGAAQRDEAFLRLKGEQGHYDLLPPGAAALRLIITEPARLAGLRFERDEATGHTLDARLLEDALRQPDALPLLQYTLRELYEQRSPEGLLTFAAYEAIGGVEGAIGRRAEAVFTSLPEAVKAAFDDALWSLITVDPDSESTPLRRRAPQPPPNDDTPRAALLTALVRERFLTADRTGNQATISLAHEALLRSWPRVVDWLRENRDLLRIRRRVEEAAGLWREKGEHSDYLLAPGLPLVEAESLLARRSSHFELDNGQLASDFVQASGRVVRRAQRRRSRIRGAVTGTFAVLMVIALAAAVVAVQKKREAAGASTRLLRAEERSKITIARESGEKDFALANIDVEKGAQLLENNDPAMAALRFSNALLETENAIERMTERGVKLLPSDAARAGIHRQRLSIVLRQLPKLAERFATVGSQLAAVRAAENGKHFLTVSSNKGGVEGTARLWERGGASHELASKARLPANSVAFRQDGYLSAVGFGMAGADNGAVEVWEVESRERVNDLATLGAATQLIFSPRRDRLAFIVARSQQHGDEAWVWDRGSDATWKRSASARINHISFSPDGERLVISSGDDTSDPPGLAEIWSFTAPPADPGYVVVLEHAAPVNCAVFEPGEGLLVATANGFRDDASQGEARVWNSRTREPVTRPLRHNRMVNFVDFSSDGQRLVTASSDATARIWDIQAGRAVLTLLHDEWVFQARFSPDGRHVVTGSGDRQARVWDLATGRLLIPPLHHDGSVTYAAFTGDGRCVVTLSRDAARLWELVTENAAAPVLETSLPIGEAARSGDGAFIATATEVKSGEPSSVQVWGSAGERIGLEAKIPGPVTVVVFSADAQRVAAANAPVSGEAEVRIWKTGTDQPLADPLRHKGAVTFAAFSPTNADRLLTVSRDPQSRPVVVQLWDLTSGKGILLPHSWPVSFASFSPDGQRVVTGSGDATARQGEARMFDAATGAAFGMVMEHAEPVTFVSFSADMANVATASIDDTARVWDAATGAPRSEPLRGLHSADLTVAKLSPNGRWLLTASYDSTAVLCEWEKWNTKARGVTITLPHGGTVNDACFSPDGERVATASSDRQARLWTATTGELIAVLPHASDVRTVTFDRAGTNVSTLAFKVWTPPRAVGSESSPLPAARPVASRSRRLGEAPVWNIAPEKVPAVDLQTLAELAAAARIENTKLVAINAVDADRSWQGLREAYAARTPHLPPLDYHLREAAICGATDRWFPAAWHLAAAVQLTNGDVGLLMRCGNAFMNDDRWKEAENYYSRAMQLFTPEQKELQYKTLLQQSSVRTRQRRWEDALRDCTKLRELQPNAHEPWSQIALIHLVQAQELTRQGQAGQAQVHWQESLAALREAVKLGTDPSPWQRLAALELKFHPENKSAYLAVCREALSKFQGDPRIAARLAWPCTLDPAMDRASLEALLPVVRQAVQSAPGNFYRLNSLGALFFRLGRYDEAYETFTQSRKAYAAERAGLLLAQINDETIPLAMAELEDGRPVDKVYLAMTCHQLSRLEAHSDEAPKLAAEAQRWLRKALDAYDAGEKGQGVDAGTPRNPWNQLELALLLRQATEMIAPVRFSSRITN